MAIDCQFYSSIQALGEHDWQRLALSHSPFLRYEFLHALESSGAVCPETGWQPQHLLVLQDEEPIAALPLYIKGHSYGEYVFDWRWADAYQQHGLDYYPKLICAIPFTPSQLDKLACANREISPPLISAIDSAIQQRCEQLQLSGFHALFLPQNQAEQLEQQGYALRTDVQYHWFNHSYSSFEHYLEQFTSRKRKSIKRERRKVAEQGVCLKVIEGGDISAEQLQHFYHCYQLTYLKRGQQGYLSLAFFRQLVANMSEQMVFFAAEFNSQQVAFALCFKGRDNTGKTTLYGRYWGCLEEFNSLHFETCYYQGIDYCIAHGFDHFDPGAQGEHKIQRGFEPTATCSAHWLAHPGFQRAVEDFVREERLFVDQRSEALRQYLPFKQSD